MRNLRSFFSLMLAAVAAVGWSGAFALDNQKAEAYANPSAIDSSGAILPGTSTVIADTAMPSLIVASFESNDQAGNVTPVSMFSLVGQNGHYRNSVTAAPPLINALSPDKALSNSDDGLPTETITVAYDTSPQLTAHDWSDSGNSADAVTPAVDIVPPEIQALKSA